MTKQEFYTLSFEEKMEIVNRIGQTTIHEELFQYPICNK